MTQFLALAILVHLAALPALELLVPEPVPPPEVERKVRRIRLSQANRSSRSQQQKPNVEVERLKKEEKDKEEEKPPEPEEEKIELDKLEGQIVEVPPTKSDEAPENSEFLSEFNTKTERETVAKAENQRNDTPAVANELTRPEFQGEADASSPKAVRLGEAQEKKDAVETEKNVFEIPDQALEQKLALNTDLNGRFRNQQGKERIEGNGKQLKLDLNADRPARESQEAQAPDKVSGAPLIPPVGVIADMFGAPFKDHIEGVDEGEGTFLNTREFKYASFFNRMKRGISQHWNPMREYRRRDPSGNIYGNRSRTTVLEVTLNQDGSLRKLDVARSSGIEFLDQEAVAALESAQPFPNPPQGLLDENDVIVFPFGFHLEFNGRGGFRF